MAFFYIAALVFGLAVGSFMNVCIFRIPEGRSIVSPPSACMSCGAYIKPYHNIPVISYMLLGGRCAYCGAGLSVQYPLIELGNGCMYVLALYRFGLSYKALGAMLLGSALVVTMLIAFERGVVPVSVAVFCAVSGIVAGPAAMGMGIASAAIGALAGGGAGLVAARLAGLSDRRADYMGVSLLGACVGGFAGYAVSVAAAAFGVVLWTSLTVAYRPVGRGPESAPSLNAAMAFAALAALFADAGPYLEGALSSL